MRICIIGAGFVGLTAAFKLSQENHQITVFEKEERAGGLAAGFKEKNWEWALERHYHHLFPSDQSIINLAKQVNQPIIFKKAKTSVFVKNKSYRFDSAVSLISFPHLSLYEKTRLSIALAYLKFSPFWRPLEKITAYDFSKKTMGQKAFNLLWKPLFDAKFRKYSNQISASWFWARIQKRSAILGYPQGGFEDFIKKITEKCRDYDVKFIFNTPVLKIKKEKNFFQVISNSQKVYKFDKVICTLPNQIFSKLVDNLPFLYQKKLTSFSGIGAINLVLASQKQLLSDGTYWLNINEKNFPFLSIVEHTNLIDKKHYGDDRIIYIGNYLEPNHPYFSKSAESLLQEFVPFLKKINHSFSTKWIRGIWLFKAPFAQPIIPINYSKKILPFKTPINGLFLANIQQIYPWDRGTNYAVELGERVAYAVSQE